MKRWIVLTMLTTLTVFCPVNNWLATAAAGDSFILDATVAIIAALYGKNSPPVSSEIGYVYDDLNRLDRVDHGNHQYTRYLYDEVGNILQVMTYFDSDDDWLSDDFEQSAQACAELDFTNPDSDGDGILDGLEDVNHNGLVDPGETDPCNWDTDGDGIPDGVELGYTDPTKWDTDGDGISDGVEDWDHDGHYDQGETNALDDDSKYGDSDDDGLFDSLEDIMCTSPLNPDSDADGLTDGTENVIRNPLVDPGETDPCDADTDKDSMNDGDEVAIGRNPLVNEPAVMSIIQNLLLRN